jgi:glutamyl/glutaminyl-tRNA synthetase
MLTRFAPAPTGVLHLGHVANAIYVWGLAVATGSRVLLRIEDHDRQRSRREYEARILDDLDWLGFAADRFPTQAFREGPCESRQSDRGAVYAAAAESLAARGLIYGCTCSRRRADNDAPGGEDRTYPGTCRDRGIEPGADVAWRLRIAPGIETSDDLVAGRQSQDPSRLFGDPVIRDRRGNWTYQFAVSVDDWQQDIDLVVRGRDLLASTGLQVRIARLLGRERPPRFAHHPLIMKTPDQKLSKSDGDTGIETWRARGARPEDVIGEAAWRVGLIPAPAPLSARDVAGVVSRATA